MAMMTGPEPIKEFSDWYTSYEVSPRDGCLDFRGIDHRGNTLWSMWLRFKREMDLRVANYRNLEKLADGQVISEKPDLPNISSGETAGLVRRIARNLVQNSPNVDVISKFDDDSVEGIFAKHVLTSKIIGSDQYSNDMQQNLFSSTKTALTLGFDCVIPALLQDAGGSWYFKYDTIHYRDVFPEPGAKDVREATNVFVRRYLTEGEVHQLVRNNTPGWDILALKKLLQNKPRSREEQSVDHQTKKHHQIPMGYEVITWYSNTGDDFLTFEGTTKMLLRIEKNKHPLKEHPVFFLVLEKDGQQPFGKSQVELLVGRQGFQDLMLNGAMKLWYRNINPSIIGYGAINTIPNLSPGKYTQISNPNAKIEPFEVNTQTLMQFGGISDANMASMVNLIGSADQQMASQGGSNGMSATPQGVDAQTQMVDITTNNYQKAIEGFYSHYCSYALTVYFQELKSMKSVTPTAEARIKLLKAGLDADFIKEDGTVDIDFATLSTEYFVRCVPGSLVEMEDEKQLRILNQMLIPLSQALPAMAQAQDAEMMKNAATAMQYIMKRQIELSGASDASSIRQLWVYGDVDGVESKDQRMDAIELSLSDMSSVNHQELELNSQAIAQLQANQSQITEVLSTLLQKLGVQEQPSEEQPNNPEVAGSTSPNLSVV